MFLENLPLDWKSTYTDHSWFSPIPAPLDSYWNQGSIQSNLLWIPNPPTQKPQDQQAIKAGFAGACWGVRAPHCQGQFRGHRSHPSHPSWRSYANESCATLASSSAAHCLPMYWPLPPLAPTTQTPFVLWWGQGRVALVKGLEKLSGNALRHT